MDSIFWVQQSILRRLDVRSSVGEQLNLDILVDCLVDPIPSSGTETRDAVYGKHDRDKPLRQRWRSAQGAVQEAFEKVDEDDGGFGLASLLESARELGGGTVVVRAQNKAC